MTALPEALYGRFSRHRTQDALGSVRMITDASGAVVARLEYGAWGEEIFVSAIPALANFPYRFVGGAGVRTDFETGLVWMRQRWYDPELARFISRDPIGLSGGANLYAYVGGNPLQWNDPSGLELPEGVGPLGESLLSQFRSIFIVAGGRSSGSIVPAGTYNQTVSATHIGMDEAQAQAAAERALGQEAQAGEKAIFEKGFRGGERIMRMRGTSGAASAELVLTTGMLLLEGAGFYTGTANWLCQDAIERYLQELVKAEHRCGSNRKKAREESHQSELYLDMMFKCNSLGVWSGARDFANSL